MLYFPNYSIWSDLEMVLMDNHLHGLLPLLMLDSSLLEHSRINHYRRRLSAPVVHALLKITNCIPNMDNSTKLRQFCPLFLVLVVQNLQYYCRL